jgi:hypothetical protein
MLWAAKDTRDESDHRYNGVWQAGSMATSARYATLVTDGAPGNLGDSHQALSDLDAMFEQAIAAAFGEPKPRRRVIKIDPPSYKPCS